MKYWPFVVAMALGVILLSGCGQDCSQALGNGVYYPVPTPVPGSAMTFGHR